MIDIFSIIINIEISLCGCWQEKLDSSICQHLFYSSKCASLYIIKKKKKKYRGIDRLLKVYLIYICYMITTSK